MHGIFGAAFCNLFTPKGKPSASSMNALLNSLVSDLTGGVVVQSSDGTGALEAAASPYVCPDVPKSKVQGVRSGKSVKWLEREETLTEIIVLVASSESVSRLSGWLFRAQHLQLWLHQDPRERPLVCLATMRFSPAVKALNDCIVAMTSGREEIIQMLDGVLA